VLQEFDFIALLNILSSLLAANLSDTVQLTPDVLTAMFDVIINACMNCETQSALSQSTSMYSVTPRLGQYVSVCRGYDC